MELYTIEGSCKSAQEAIALACDRLREAGAVKESFLAGCLKREEEYPTGLPTAIPVAVPHTVPEHVEHSAICAVRLGSPVAFACMGDPDETVMAEYVFVMALKGEQDQLKTLKKLMKLAQNEERLTAWRSVELEQMARELEESLQG